MAKTICRILSAILLMLLAIPPLSVGVANLFVFLPGIIGIFLLLWPLMRKGLKRLSEKKQKWIRKTFLILLLTASLCIAAELTVIFINQIPAEAPAGSVVVVLGAQVRNSRPTLILSGRIKAAADYLLAHPDAVCIASGGRGADEDISEAQCIRDTLVAVYGITEDRIYMEDRSTSTDENLGYSAEIIRANGLSSNVVIATDGFHMFRARLIAGRKGLHAYPCCAATDPRLALYLYIRECLAIPKTLLLVR